MKRFKDKPIDSNQPVLIPLSLEELIPKTSFVRNFAKIVDQLDKFELIEKYRGGGAPAYDPCIMLNLLLFGQVNGIHNSRKLAELNQYDVRYMWLMQMSRPDPRTITRFRQQNKELVDTFFIQMVQLAKKRRLKLPDNSVVNEAKEAVKKMSEQAKSQAKLERQNTKK